MQAYFTIYALMGRHYLKVTLVRDVGDNHVTHAKIYSPIANEIINDPGCELFNDTSSMKLTGEAVLSLCEEFSRKPLEGKEFHDVSRDPSLYPYWVMAEGAREIRYIWELSPFYLGQTDKLPERAKLISQYLDWDCRYSFWQALDKFCRAILNNDIKQEDNPTTSMIHYLGIVYGKSIELINETHGQWLALDLRKLGDHLYVFLTHGDETERQFISSLILRKLRTISRWVKILHEELPAYESSRLRGEKPTNTLAAQVVKKLREQPIPARVVEVDKSAGKSLRAAMNDNKDKPTIKSKAGRSRSSHIGEEFCGIKIDANCEVLHIKGEGDFRFKGTSQWKIIDKLVDAWFDNFKKTIVGQKPEIQKIFTSKDGKRLMKIIHFETFGETKTKNPGRNSKYTGRAWFNRKPR